MTLVEREGHVRRFHVAKVNAATLRGVLVANVDRASTLSTDDFPGYYPVGREFKAHGTVTHKDGEYAATKTIPHIWTSAGEVALQHRRKLLLDLQARRDRHLSPSERAHHCTATAASSIFATTPAT